MIEEKEMKASNLSEVIVIGTYLNFRVVRNIFIVLILIKIKEKRGR